MTGMRCFIIFSTIALCSAGTFLNASYICFMAWLIWPDIAFIVSRSITK